MSTNSSSAIITIESISAKGTAVRTGFSEKPAADLAAGWQAQQESVLVSTVSDEGSHYVVATDHAKSFIDRLWITPISDAAYAAAEEGDGSVARGEVEATDPAHFKNLAAA